MLISVELRCKYESYVIYLQSEGIFQNREKQCVDPNSLFDVLSSSYDL